MDQTRYAMVSAYDKSNLEGLVRAIDRAGYRIISSSGTAKFIRSLGIQVTEVEEVTGYPHLFGGRVKTLHPKVAGGILFREAEDSEEAASHQVPRIDLVVCTLYPFEEAARAQAPIEELIEKIDIGGVTLIRAAAKNHRRVAVVCHPADYESVASELDSLGAVSPKTRERLAVKAFSVTAAYDGTISAVLSDRIGTGSPMKDASIARTAIPLWRVQRLRYGENPYQEASLWDRLGEPPFRLLGGKELSYNNILDSDAALRGILLFRDSCAAVIIKHTNPCGAALGDTIGEALASAIDCDPVSAFGGIVGLTRPVDLQAAEILADRFFEVVLAPSFHPEALELLRSRRGSLRLVEATSPRMEVMLRDTLLGTLVQEDPIPVPPREEDGTWHGKRRPDLWDDLVFAWKCAALAKSNAIAVAKGGRLLGLGCGFTNRVDAAAFALGKAGDVAHGAAMASDAFLPFPDTVEVAHSKGVGAIIQPGGSVRDRDVIDRALELELSMFMGGTRTFRH
ncbi:bifunctional phosphoribosylaminoimidazolecarboxamide formyltransferase/IMP cyclohydrolase [Thermanaerovibrio acidaminovorans]|uniref:bifunctional phosphoribosylaminoimidazolecarboxamide formyltransferase/IMP cyclohydrolase n=1 Tax=Thermanaerovibrio acidaminovorans TaxID=81462 RepID=UPI002491B3C2|nr:bifunctional phosphoribosylaminoimidazolecarboxamide formyltransferase/IMP cyclohydrolase [Thermanaerovibrio acidaminovorans]